MWQKFTERARKAIFLGQEEAQRLNDDPITTGHLLLGLMQMEGSTAMEILNRLGIGPEAVINEVRRILQPGDAEPNEDIVSSGLSKYAKVAIDRAYEEARALDNDYIGTEHLLLGLTAEAVGAGRVLARLGADLESARGVLREMQGKQTQ